MNYQGSFKMIGYCEDCRNSYFHCQCRLWTKEDEDETQKLKKQNKIMRDALGNVLKTEDHMGYESKWISYNTSHLRSIARQVLKQVEEL
jgi:hypothetical protein